MTESVPKDPTSIEEEAAMLARNGITRVTVHHYEVGGYRYSNVADALAQVRRSAPDRRT